MLGAISFLPGRGSFGQASQIVDRLDTAWSGSVPIPQRQILIFVAAAWRVAAYPYTVNAVRLQSFGQPPGWRYPALRGDVFPGTTQIRCRTSRGAAHCALG